MTHWWIPLTAFLLIAAVAAGIISKRFLAEDAAQNPAPHSATPVWQPAKPQAADAQTKGLSAVFDQDLDDNARLKPLASGALPPVAEADLPRLHALIANPSEGDTLRNEVFNLLRREGDEQLVVTAEAVLNNPKESDRFRSFAVQHLDAWRRDSRASGAVVQGISQLLARLMDDAGLATRREAWWALAQDAQDADDAALSRAKATLASGEPVDELDLAIRIARHHSWRDVLPQLRLAASHDQLTVRIAAIEALGFFADETARSLLENAASSSVPRLADAATLALKRLDGAASKEP